MPEQPEQVRVPYPPDRYDRDKGRIRTKPEVSVQDSYRLNTIRLALPGQAAIDVIPATEAHACSVDPRTVLGAPSPVWIMSGCNAFGRLSTPHEQLSTTDILHQYLDLMGWTWHPAVLMSPGREWVETGAVVLGPSRDETLSTARYHGQEVVLLWDASGVSTIATGLAGLAIDVVDGPAVAVVASPALLGCPMRFGADAVCVRQGGPFVSRSIEVAGAWQRHRALLVSAIGCTVCDGAFIDGRGGPISLASAFVPSRRGGWQWGSPLPATDLYPRPAAPGIPADDANGGEGE
jgi:hypothetical protein